MAGPFPGAGSCAGQQRHGGGAWPQLGTSGEIEGWVEWAGLAWNLAQLPNWHHPQFGRVWLAVWHSSWFGTAHGLAQPGLA